MERAGGGPAGHAPPPAVALRGYARALRAGDVAGTKARPARARAGPWRAERSADWQLEGLEVERSGEAGWMLSPSEVERTHAVAQELGHGAGGVAQLQGHGL